jgi:hypothetical protein
MLELTKSTLLVKYLKQHPKGAEFPEPTADYFKRFQAIDEFLNEKVHPVVNAGAKSDKDGWLTDHGPDHIANVIRRASDLSFTGGEKTFLKPYEVFILLVACHLHDVGNVFGRIEHEKKIGKVLKTISDDIGASTLGHDTLELRVITGIAMAHGGYADISRSDKDTINPLRAKWPSKDSSVRVPLLAAVLRFADELADDHTRTSRFLLESGVIPPKSQIYHTYANRLKEVQIRPADNSILVRFEISTTDTQSKFGKGRKKVYLFDEIINRALKMHNEHVYCSKFFSGRIHIDAINVRVNISSDISTDQFVDVVDQVTFSMQQIGYPKQPASLVEVSGELSELDGVKLMRQIKKKLCTGSIK